jgi:hypothetical protein
MGAATDAIGTPFRLVPATARPGDGPDPTPTRATNDGSARLAARDVLGGAVVGRDEFVEAVADLIPEAMPTADYETVARCVRSLADDARAVTTLAIFEEAQRLGIDDPAHVAVVAEELATYAAGTVIRAEYIPERVRTLTEAAARAATRERRHRASVILEDPGIPDEDARIILADMDPFADDTTSRPLLQLADLSRWRDLAATDVPSVFRQGGARKTFGVLFGESGLGKGFIALCALMAVALGFALLKFLEPERQGRALYLSGEDSEIVVAQRMLSNADAHGINPADIDAAIADGRLLLIAGGAKPLLQFDRTGTPTRTAAYREIRRLCEREKPDLIVIDPAASWGGLSAENDNGQMAALAACLIDLATAADGFLMLVHHANKSGSKTLDQASSRGATALFCACRHGIGARGIDPDTAKSLGIALEDAWRFLEVGIVKNSYFGQPDGGPFYLERKAGGALIDADLVTARKNRIACALVAAIREADTGLTVSEIVKAKGAGKTVKDAIAEDLEFKPDGRTLERAISECINDGRLTLREVSRTRGPRRFEVQIP